MFPISITVPEPIPFPLETINARLKEILCTGSTDLDQIITYLLEEPGKLLRPRLVYLTSSLYPAQHSAVRDAAVATELIHMASLVHDDVIDHSSLRRGRASINSCWGNKASVLTGDYLFAAAFHLINQLDSPAIMDIITNTIKVMCTGEIKQLSEAFNWDLSLDEYLDKIYRKTACLFECCCIVGGLAAQMPAPAINTLGQLGHNLGLAYQIIDDVLDFISTPDHLGKPVGSDLLEGNMTLPVIYALQDTDIGGKLRSMLPSVSVSPQTLSQSIDLIKQSSSIRASLMTARSYLHNVRHLIEAFPDSPARQALLALARGLFDDYLLSKAPGFEWGNEYDHPLS